MSNTELHDRVVRVISRILEDAAFVFTDTLAPEDIPPAEEWAATGIALDFAGEPSGTLHVWASNGFSCYLSANMLGIDADSPDACSKGLDSLKELLNMIVGNFITVAYGEQKVFHLGLPTELTADVMKSDHANPEAIWLEADGNPVLFVVTVKE